MPSRRPATPRTLRSGSIVHLRSPERADAAAFVAAALASRRLHGRWVRAPESEALFLAYAARFGVAPRPAPEVRDVGLLVCRNDDGALAGAFNFGDITRGALQSAYLGYFALVPHAGCGCMAEGLRLALDVAFRTLELHRVEVNVQPENARSLAFAERAGFRREGYSPRYLKIQGRWRDHVRCALLVDDWRARQRAR